MAGFAALSAMGCRAPESTTPSAAPPTAAATAIAAADDQTLEASNLRLLSWTNLNGRGAMGEGIAIQKVGSRRIAYLANESGATGMSVVDVTDPKNPGILVQVPAENNAVRFNSLSMSGNILAVARQTQSAGQTPAGLTIYDASQPENLKRLAHFNTSGPFSRGCHFVWFVDGRYAHMSTGMPDFKPTTSNDDQIYVIVDLKDPEHPVEVGRWWLPGQKDGEKPLARHPQFDTGHRLHNVNVLPSKPDRAYTGWIDSGAAILDISDMQKPKLLSQWNPHPPGPGFTHTAVPHLARNLMVVSDEAVQDDCKDAHKRIWVLDISKETSPVLLSTAPIPDPEVYCKRGGRFGAHNQHENHAQPTAKELHNTVVGSFFNGGVRIYDISKPTTPQEIAFFVPKAPVGSSVKSSQINDVFVDETGVIYAIERFAGGLYILEYTGKTPLT
jgi:hypothetical protein